MHPGNTRIQQRQVRLMLAALLLTILQIAAISHLVGHTASGDNAGCELCLSAGHAGSAMVPTIIALAFFAGIPGKLLPIAEIAESLRTPDIFRARGPPLSI